MCQILRGVQGSASLKRTKDEVRIDKGRKRVLAIVAGILVARHLKTPEDLGESPPSPRTECLIASAVQWADRSMTGSTACSTIRRGTENDDREPRGNVDLGVAPGELKTVRRSRSKAFTILS